MRVVCQQTKERFMLLSTAMGKGEGGGGVVQYILFTLNTRIICDVTSRQNANEQVCINVDYTGVVTASDQTQT